MGLLDKLLNSPEQSPDFWYLSGKDLCMNGYYLDALDALDKMLAADPLHADSWFLKGYAHYQIGRYDEALQFFNRALDINKQLDEALTYKGLIYSGFGKNSEALNLYDQALSLAPGSTKTWYVRGLTLALQERFDDAIRSYEKVLALEPKHFDALTGINIAMKKRDKGKGGNAPQPVRETTSHQQDIVQIAQPTACDVSLQVKPFISILAKDPMQPGTPSITDEDTLVPPSEINQIQRRMVQLASDPASESRLHSPVMLPEITPHPIKIRETYSKETLPNGQASYDEMILELRGILAKNPCDAGSWYSLGDLYMRIGKFPFAVDAYEHSLDNDMENAESWAALGDARKKTGTYDEALAAYERSLEIKPDNPEVWITHAKTIAMLGRYENAIESCNRAIIIDGTNIDAWLYKGFILRKIKRHDDALTAYDQVLMIQPGHDQAIRQRKSLIGGN
ncbi:MAG: tetratricopeptide repeat protein [Methanoregula sp.]|jgi:tetratricopeptide (TPR) repeat protein|nr:tetratricopeptide repeat protein [Methanoregula sp.]